ncbi:MAG TPA: DNA replication and repair protein RecF, partial [Fimbriimonadaceae bacterium]|nr:DNA replication and repair protein RecF [Fimbriimonadaceae bacterium]
MGNALFVRHVSLTSFRNYARLDIDLSSGFNVIFGENGQGKTNFLESLVLVSSTRLLRGMRDAEAILIGSERASVSAVVGYRGMELGVILQPGIRKKALLNGLGLPRAADLIGRLPAVCVSAADLPIVSGEPSDRRTFLDIELAQLFPAYLRDLTIYKRAVEQRNALLRLAQETSVSPDQFHPWENQIADHGSAIRASRVRFVESLNEHARSVQAFLGLGEVLTLSYQPKDQATNAESLLDALERHRPQETARGSGLIGPHRDEVLIEVNGREARLFGSQGQQRTAMIAIKFATYLFGKQELGFAPLLLLDDLFSDLDFGRRSRLVEWVLG